MKNLPCKGSVSQSNYFAVINALHNIKSKYIVSYKKNLILNLLTYL